MNNKNKISQINLKKEPKLQQVQNNTTKKIDYKNILIILLVFALVFCFGKLSEKPNTELPIAQNNNTTIQSTTTVKSNTEQIVTPFKPNDIVITAEAAEQTSEGYMVRGKITNNSNIPFEDVSVTINVNNGEDVTYFDTCGSTIMPGESFSGKGISTNKIKSLKAIDARIEWSDNNNKYWSYVDLQLNKIESGIINY